MSDLKNQDTNIQVEQVLELKEHDWYDPEIVWVSTYSPDSVCISNYALRFVCKNCLIEVIGVTGSQELIEKLNKKSCDG
jgi:hypothetical protein